MSARPNAAETSTVHSLFSPDAYTAATAQSSGIDVSDAEEVEIELHVGVIASGGTLDVAVEHSDASGSGYAAMNDVSGSAIAFAQATDATADGTIFRIVIPRIRGIMKKYVRVEAVGATAAGDWSVTLRKHGLVESVLESADATLQVM